MEELSRGYASVADQCGVVELIGSLLTRFGDERQQETGSLTLCPRARKPPTASRNPRPAQTCPVSEQPRCAIGGLDPQRRQTLDSQCSRRRSGVCACAHRSVSWQSRHVDLHRPLDARGVGRGPKEHKMGQRASQVGALTFDDVELPRMRCLAKRAVVST